MMEAIENTELYKAVRRRNRCPTRPSDILKDDVFPALYTSVGLTLTDIAGRLGISRQSLHRILSGDSAITIDMAHRLGTFLGNGPNLWIRMQAAYDLWQYQQTEDYKRTCDIRPLEGVDISPVDHFYG